MNKEYIWNSLGRYGFSDKAKAAIMGNIGPESNFDPYNVEDRYKGDDHAYVAAIDAGTYTRDEFATDHGQYLGFGLCQWTYWSRKCGLYDLAKGRGVSIADLDMQLDYMWQELQTSEFSSVLSVLRSDASLREMTEKFMTDFERPADKSQWAKNYRVGMAEEAYKEFAGTTQEPQEDEPTTPFWPPRVLCLGMVGSDVTLLQSLLLCHGFNCGGCSGIYGVSTRNMVIGFQAQNDLEQDGVAGPKTFRKLGVMV